MPTFAIPKRNNGVIAQLVEQRTENPCVPGSIPGDTTRISKVGHKKSCIAATLFYFCWYQYHGHGRHIVQLYRHLSGSTKGLPASLRFCMIVIKIIALSPNQFPFCGIRIFLSHRPEIA